MLAVLISTALREKLLSMGYELTDEELEAVFARFKVLADKKKNITAADIADAMAAINTFEESLVVYVESLGELSNPCQYLY